MSKAKDQFPSRVEAVRIIDLQPGVPLTVRFLGPCLGMIAHWHSGRSHPCPGPADCLPAIHRCRSVWKGFAPGESWDETRRLWFPGVVPVTEALEEVLRGRTLRGEVWVLARHVEGRKALPVTGVYCERQPECSLSPVFDITPVLLRAFHVPSILLGIPNPVPAKLEIGPSAGPAPQMPAELVPAPEKLASPEEIRKVMEMLKGRGAKRPAPEKGQASANGQS